MEGPLPELSWQSIHAECNLPPLSVKRGLRVIVELNCRVGCGVSLQPAGFGSGLVVYTVLVRPASFAGQRREL